MLSMAGHLTIFPSRTCGPIPVHPFRAENTVGRDRYSVAGDLHRGVRAFHDADRPVPGVVRLRLRPDPFSRDLQSETVGNAFCNPEHSSHFNT